MSIADTLRMAANRWPSRIAVSDLDHPGGRIDVTYSTFYDAVQRVASSFLDLGLQRNDRVGLLMLNSYEYLVAFYGAATAGLVVVPLNVRLLEDELSHMLKDTESRVLIADEGLLRDMPSLGRIPEFGSVVVHSGESSEWTLWQELVNGEGRLEPVTLDPEQILSIIYTSGTTGLPKGVMLSHRVWSNVAELAIKHLDYRESGENTLGAAPITHGAGFFILPTIAVGGKNVLINRFDAERILGLFTTEEITSLHLVPTMIRLLLDTVEEATPIGPFLKALSYAGSTIDRRTMREALDSFGPTLVQSFGQMEYPMFMSVLSPQEHINAALDNSELLLSTGRAVEGTELKILTSDGREADTGEYGEICGRGPLAMSGYWRRPAESAATIDQEGWVRTGDLGRLDQDGYLYVSGRAKDMIISGGSNVYAREVEDVLVSIPGIAEAAVVGVPHPVWGEAVVAALVAANGGGMSTDEVLHACKARLPGFRRPKAVVWVDKLPTNAYGKVLKRTLKDELSKKELL